MVDSTLAISITGLEKSYGHKKVLKGINLEVFEGELFAFIGANGAGKSTTIESLNQERSNRCKESNRVCPF